MRLFVKKVVLIVASLVPIASISFAAKGALRFGDEDPTVRPLDRGEGYSSW